MNPRFSAWVEQGCDPLRVHAPFDERFVAAARRIGGRWDPQAKLWTVPAKAAAKLRCIMLEVYKTDGGLAAPREGVVAVLGDLAKSRW